MRELGRLTVKGIERLKEPGWYADGGNLYLQIAPGGSRQWILRYMRDGRAKVMGLGPLHTFTLAEARDRARAARQLLADGVDPLEQRRAEQDKRRADERARLTFQQAVNKFLEVHEAGWRNAKQRAQWRSTIETYLKGLLDRPVSELDTATINETLAPIWTSKSETASRTKQRAERILQWVRDGMPLPGRRGKDVAHHKAIPYDDLPAFLAELRKRDSASAWALEFLILTAARTGEVIGAQWKEIDLKNRVWTVPASRMKAGKVHRVPLSDRVLKILEKLPREGAYVFPGARTGKPLSNMAMLELLRGMGGNGYTVHGFRSAFTDWAHDRTAFPKTTVDTALAHTVGDKVEAAYRRGEMYDKRAKLMQAWSDYCAKPRATTAKIVPIGRRA